ncbi:permease-like cell division protein FtsX [Proteocatella sphenisci]|uniref:permease-like cell division protein FtsX n=1 Tax=Proteocatella sphenisci TaxID=181070 RepID=UPI00048E4BAB|nr:permease-like cell division protein FtsX [Proteocatella sphenisci]
MLNNVIYSIKEGLKGLTRNRSMSLASIASVASSLFVLGIMLCIVLNINFISEQTKEQFNSVQVFLEDDLNKDDIISVRTNIEKIENVRSITYETKEQALVNLKQRWGENSYLLEGIDNPLQNSYIVEIEDTQKADQMVADIQKLDKIDDISYYKDIVQQLNSIASTVNKFGLALMAILTFVSVFIIATTIKLTLYARKREIFIMKYIGATNWFVRWPFIIEGLILGFIGAVIAIFVTYGLYGVVYDFLISSSMNFINGYLININDILGTISKVFISMGIGIGTVGSVISVRRYLEV